MNNILQLFQSFAPDRGTQIFLLIAVLLLVVLVIAASVLSTMRQRKVQRAILAMQKDISEINQHLHNQSQTPENK
jgi:cell division protein FtsL